MAPPESPDARNDEGWRAVSDAERATRPVFVVGVPRSGTTALRNTLERHPSFAPKTRGTAETRVFLRPRRILQILEPPGEALLEFFLGDRDTAHQMLETARAIPDAEGAGRTDLARVFFHFARRARGVRRLVEKTPLHALHLPELRAAYPLARVVSCVRHPVEVYSSYRKRLDRVRQRSQDEDRLRWLAASPEAFAVSYAECVQAILEDEARNPESARRIRYEDLTADPREQLEALCRFVDEPFEAGPLLDDVEVRRDEHGSPRLRARIAPNEKSWRAFLDDATARGIEEALSAEMQRLGYAPAS